jgi:hypothetical protein
MDVFKAKAQVMILVGDGSSLKKITEAALGDYCTIPGPTRRIALLDVPEGELDYRKLAKEAAKNSMPGAKIFLFTKRLPT